MYSLGTDRMENSASNSSTVAAFFSNNSSVDSSAYFAAETCLQHHYWAVDIFPSSIISVFNQVTVWFGGSSLCFVSYPFVVDLSMFPTLHEKKEQKAMEIALHYSVNLCLPLKSSYVRQSLFMPLFSFSFARIVLNIFSSLVAYPTIVLDLLLLFSNILT